MPDGGAEDRPGIALLHDRQGAFAAAYGTEEASFLVRPDGYLGWRGRSWRDAGLLLHLGGIFRPMLLPDRGGEGIRGAEPPPG
jgi:hypothetical protein